MQENNHCSCDWSVPVEPGGWRDAHKNNQSNSFPGDKHSAYLHGTTSASPRLVGLCYVFRISLIWLTLYRQAVLQVINWMEILIIIYSSRYHSVREMNQDAYHVLSKLLAQLDSREGAHRPGAALTRESALREILCFFNNPHISTLRGSPDSVVISIQNGTHRRLKEAKKVLHPLRTPQLQLAALSVDNLRRNLY